VRFCVEYIEFKGDWENLISNSFVKWEWRKFDLFCKSIDWHNCQSVYFIWICLRMDYYNLIHLLDN